MSETLIPPAEILDVSEVTLEPELVGEPIKNWGMSMVTDEVSQVLVGEAGSPEELQRKSLLEAIVYRLVFHQLRQAITSSEEKQLWMQKIERGVPDPEIATILNAQLSDIATNPQGFDARSLFEPVKL